ncbi:MAG TPA: hypothetical protein VE782_16205 [Myxococcaceae bacterium]|nr:hypothetical protein [Myxococcaceae bacterium]
MRHQYQEKGVGFLAVSIEPDPALVRRGAERIGIGMTVATSSDETLGPLSVNQVPSTVFVDRHGVIVAAASGGRSRGFFEDRVKELLR